MKKWTKVTLGVVGGTALLCTAGYAILLAILYKIDRDRSCYEDEDYDDSWQDEDDFFEDEEDDEEIDEWMDEDIAKEYDEEDQSTETKADVSKTASNDEKKTGDTKMDGDAVRELVRKQRAEADEEQQSKEQKETKTMEETLHDFLMK